MKHATATITEDVVTIHYMRRIFRYRWASKPGFWERNQWLRFDAYGKRLTHPVPEVVAELVAKLPKGKP